MFTKSRVKKPEPPRQRENPVWWTPECEEAIRARRRTLKQLKAHRNDENLKNFRKARSKAKRLIRDLKAAAGLNGKSKSDSGEDSKSEDLKTASAEKRDVQKEGESAVETECSNRDVDIKDSESQLGKSNFKDAGGLATSEQLSAEETLVNETKDDQNVTADAPSG